MATRKSGRAGNGAGKRKAGSVPDEPVRITKGWLPWWVLTLVRRSGGRMRLQKILDHARPQVSAKDWPDARRLILRQVTPGSRLSRGGLLRRTGERGSHVIELLPDGRTALIEAERWARKLQRSATDHDA